MGLGSGGDEVGALAVDYEMAAPGLDPHAAAGGAAVDEEMEMPRTPETDRFGSGSLVTNLARGAVAGAVGTWTMDKVTPPPRTRAGAWSAQDRSPATRAGPIEAPQTRWCGGGGG
jgi:hypothetical protein